MQMVLSTIQVRRGEGQKGREWLLTYVVPSDNPELAWEQGGTYCLVDIRARATIPGLPEQPSHWCALAALVGNDYTVEGLAGITTQKILDSDELQALCRVTYTPRLVAEIEKTEHWQDWLSRGNNASMTATTARGKSLNVVTAEDAFLGQTQPVAPVLRLLNLCDQLQGVSHAIRGLELVRLEDLLRRDFSQAPTRVVVTDQRGEHVTVRRVLW